MITFQTTAEVTDDRHIVLTLPPEVPIGQANLTVMVSSPEDESKPARTSLADWAEHNAEHWGDQLRSTDVEGFTGRRY